jgi:hypothetical protein
MPFNKEFTLQYGLVYSGVVIAYSLVSYLLGIDFMLNWFNVGFSLILPFLVTFFIGVKGREANGGFITWKESFIQLFLVLAAGMFVTVAFTFILNTTIDPDLPMKLYEATTDKTMSMMESMGSDQETLDRMYQEFANKKEEVMESYTLLGFVQSYTTSLLFAAVIAALIAVFVKRENPNPFAETEA